MRVAVLVNPFRRHRDIVIEKNQYFMLRVSCSKIAGKGFAMILRRKNP